MEGVSKIKLDSGAASTKPEDFDVLFDFEDCFPVPEEKEPVLCNCEPPKKTKIFITGKKGQELRTEFSQMPILE